MQNSVPMTSAPIAMLVTNYNSQSGLRMNWPFVVKKEDLRKAD